MINESPRCRVFKSQRKPVSRRKRSPHRRLCARRREDSTTRRLEDYTSPGPMLSPMKTNKGVRIGLRSKFVAAFASQIIVVTLLVLGIQQVLVRRAMIGQTVEQGAAIARRGRSDCWLLRDLRPHRRSQEHRRRSRAQPFGLVCGVPRRQWQGAGLEQRRGPGRTGESQTAAGARRACRSGTAHLHRSVLRDESRRRESEREAKGLLPPADERVAGGEGRVVAAPMEHGHHRAGPRAGECPGLGRVALHRAADPRARGDRRADREGRSHAARQRRLRRRDRESGRGVQCDGGEPRADDQEPRAIADEAQVRRRRRRHALAVGHPTASTSSAQSSTTPTTRSINSTAASGKSPTTSKRSPRRRKKRRRRCWRWWRRWKK